VKKQDNHTIQPDFKSLFEAAPGLYLVLSPSLKIVAASDAYIKATKTRRDEIIGRGIFDVFPDNPDDPGATGVGNLSASLKRVLQKKQPDAMAVQKYDIPLPQSEGGGFEERYWSPFNSPVLNEDNTIEYIIHRVEDVTDFIHLKQKGIEQDKLTEDLKLRTEQMESEIYSRAQQLQQANEKLRESEKLKDQFLANMSHEIRTPMNAIIGFAGLLDKTGLDEKQNEFLTAIKESGQNLMGIINDILDFSKIQAGMIEFEHIAFSVRGLVDSVHRLLANKAEVKNIDFIVHFDDHIHELLSGDPTRMTQILVNLISNAIKFTEKGHVKLDVNLKERKQNFRIIEFRIEDSGVGIAPEHLNTIFERFTQASSDTTRKYGGTGLGLSIVKNLVELQGGTIDVKSAKSKGSVFTITIPFRTVSYEQLVDYKASHIIDKIKELKGIKVLVVEDNKMNQRLALEVLSGFSIVAKVAENGKDAIKKLRAQYFDVILMDMQMAEMDGYQATSYIRKKLKNNTPIIAMTAHAMAGEREKCLALGMNDYISKPFKTVELYNKIRNVLPLKTTEEDEKEFEESNLPSGLIDLTYIKEIMGGNTSFLHEMINIFISEVPVFMDQMEKAIHKKDYHAIYQLSHKLQTSSGLMGITELTNNLLLIEKKCEAKATIDEINETFSKAKQISIDAIKELEKEKQQRTKAIL
jgi:signal transduction histidine kinase/CheY-like chemotaxis protein/HPt (histidine-containing phosphotransfer) domain-containing protein